MSFAVILAQFAITTWCLLYYWCNMYCASPTGQVPQPLSSQLGNLTNHHLIVVMMMHDPASLTVTLIMTIDHIEHGDDDDVTFSG